MVDSPAAAHPGRRVLILTPTGKDASLTQSILAHSGVESFCCSKLEDVCEALDEGAGALLVAEEAVQHENRPLVEWLVRQPPWSDLPILVLARSGADSAAVAQSMDQLGNVTVLERPIRVAALVSAIRTALRARQRQYEARAHLGQIERSEGDLRDFFDNASIGLHWIGPDGTLLRANRTELELLGYAPDEYVGHHVAEFHCRPEAMRSVLVRLIRGEVVPEYEAELRCKDGSTRHVMIHSNALFENGRLVHTRDFTRDITDRRIAEAERERFALLAERSQDFIGISTPEGIPTYINPAGLRIVGLESFEDARKITVLDFLFPEDRAMVWDEYIPRIVREGSGQIDIRFRHFKTGEPIWMTFGVVALKDSAGKLTALATVSRNVTERKRMEEALRDADRRKDEFLAILAHELRNPLAPIRNSLHILRLTSRHDPTGDRVGEMMERQVNHMVRLVDDLLEVSRITRGKIELRKEEVEVAAIVEGAVETSQPLIDAAGHQLIVEVPEEPLRVEGDPVRLAQVLANLINNAAKYTEPGGRIWISVRREGQSAMISVRDSGMGIPAEMLPRVFEMFTQVDRHADRAQGGLGIGLTLVKSLVEMHGGSITAASEGPGRGSDFVVRLALATPHPVGSAAIAARDPEAGVPGPRRVIIVDDNQDAAQSMGMLLKLLGAEVHVVYNGPDALKALPTYRPDAVLLDIGMPGMDGYEVARRIRAQPEWKGLTLIALTGWGQENDRKTSEAAGFNYHLIKPADVAAIQSVLDSLESRPGERRVRQRT